MRGEVIVLEWCPVAAVLGFLEACLIVRRIGRPAGLNLICATLLAFITTAAARDPAESLLRPGNRLLSQGLLPEAVAAYTRALQQNPKGPIVYY